MPVYQPLYRTRCLPDAEWQRCLLESLRYKWGHYKNATRLMQSYGDAGRAALGVGDEPGLFLTALEWAARRFGGDANDALDRALIQAAQERQETP
jgi:hypothetical protein